jgi:hypothetical protein
LCLISSYKPGVMPERAHLANGIALNPHGSGFAIQLPDGTQRVWKHLNGHAILDDFIDQRRKYPDGWAVFHSRYATAGNPVMIANVQPLVLPDDQPWGHQSVLVHNGGLFPVEGEASDTRVFIDEVLPNWNLDRDLGELEAALGRNKMILQPASGEPTLLNAHLGVWLPDGSWQSNHDYSGNSHLAPGQCSSCHTPLPGAPAATLCDECRERFETRRGVLVPKSQRQPSARNGQRESRQK